MEEFESTDWLLELRKLERYCNKKGYAVLYQAVKQDAIYFQEKRIVLGNQHSNEIALYYLLHEMGHDVVLNKKNYEDVYQHIFDNFSKSSITNKLAIIQEELDAWKEGFKLANRLGIKVDRRKFEITKSKCLCTYLTWAKNRR